MFNFMKSRPKSRLSPVFKANDKLTAKAVKTLMSLYKKGGLTSIQAENSLEVLFNLYGISNTNTDDVYNLIEQWYERDLQNITEKLKANLDILIENELLSKSFDAQQVNERVRSKAEELIQRNSDAITAALRKARFFKVAYYEYTIINYFKNNSGLKPSKESFETIKLEVEEAFDFYMNTTSQDALEKLTNRGNYFYVSLEDAVKQKQEYLSDQSLSPRPPKP